ncbi:TPA: anaerobic ribonucleoside-triphosphate reductase [Candidatus Dependentiae bacterium]|nr:MAG: Oxygen-sensitive ribonucleoside-triphosphate reductase-like protein [candidate division TM6 bacterium GW2011_GWE2_31_21]KKP53190.1 MAG: Oxygen-sensitive ribonucleoside-triphosphate reductase-like protein [candidate division TM6 bacterium GW2011_GWF2_33_332]HBS48008.1 anaerobic ribonucleoside-triphosphate reductase [Candidatus Dependentiae bacterium]HBZ73388.1 anaerobic ribonucleoside-triphosphate reductase [Candidatus Dependentiae bacterium]
MELHNILKSVSPDFLELYNSTDKFLLKEEGIAVENLDVFSMADKYANEQLVDMSIDSNANAHEGKAYGNYIMEISKGWLKLLGYYRLYEQLKKDYSQERAKELLTSILNGDLYFHDSTSIEIPYCWAYSTYFMLSQGCRWGQLESLPAHNRKSFLDQVKEVTIELAQELAGAVAIGDIFINYSYFVKREGLDLSDPVARKSIENDFQSLVHTLNKKLRPSFQSPFSNISIFDRPNLEYLFGESRFPDGSAPDFDLIEGLQKIFCDWFKKGDPTSGLPYRFPVVTLNLRISEDRQILDQKSFEYFSQINLEKGCFNIYISSGNKVASCCRLVNDFDLAGCDSFGNGGLSLGSHRVVTVNLARLGFIAKTFDELVFLSRKKMEEARDILLSHRRLLKDRIDKGMINFVKRGIVFEERLFSTFGINGVYESLELLGYSLLTQKGKDLAKFLLEDIRNFSLESNKQFKVPFNIEQVPAESLAIKFAIKDAYLYGMNYKIYSNQFIPLSVDCDIADRIAIDGCMSKSLTGGGISHINVGEKLTSVDQMKKLILYAVKSGCEHFAVNYNFAVCTNKHVTVSGNSKVCSICGAEIINNYTRIIGYFVPVSSWNKGRRTEHQTRVFKSENEVNENISHFDLFSKIEKNNTVTF